MKKLLIAGLFSLAVFSLNAQQGTTQKTKKPTQTHRNSASDSSTGVNGENGLVQSDTTRHKGHTNRTGKKGGSTKKGSKKSLQTDTTNRTDTSGTSL